MPFYDYFCESNKKTIEVFHNMKTYLKTWGEVCEFTGTSIGDTSPDAQVVRMISQVTPMVFRVKGLDKDEPSDKLEL